MVIISNTAVMASQSYPGNPDWQNISDYLNVGFCCYFTVELLVKLMGSGPRVFIRDRMNQFDALVVVASLVEMGMFLAPGDDACKCGSWWHCMQLDLLALFRHGCEPAEWCTLCTDNTPDSGGLHATCKHECQGACCHRLLFVDVASSLCLRLCLRPLVLVMVCGCCAAAAASSTLSVLRTARLLRVFKLARSWSELNRIITTILKSFSQVMYLSLLLMLFVFVFALMVSPTGQRNCCNTRNACLHSGTTAHWV